MRETSPPTSPSPASLLEAAGVAVGSTPQQLARLAEGKHVCFIYETFEEQMATFGPFLRMGLEQGERCVYITDEHTREEVLEALRAHDVDVERALGHGALILASARETYLRWGQVVPENLLDLLRQLEAEAVAAGFKALRVTAEATWALGSDARPEQFIRFESLLNRFYPGSHSSGLCQFNRKRFPPELIRDVLRTHPWTIVEDEVHENLFYETPEMLLGEESAAERVEWMVSQLKRVRAAERTLVSLGTRLAEQSRENARLYEEARAAVRTRDDFLSVASHELKTPLTPLQLRLQALRRETEADEGESVPRARVARLVEGAEQQMRRLATLVDALLDVSRLATGQVLLHPRDVDLAEVAREVVGGLAPRGARMGCRVEVEAEVPVMGRWDRMRVEQVVTNLLSNALKYGRGRPVHVRVEGGPEWAVLEVRDEGIGIAAEHRSRIFGKFERAVSGRHYGGLGLGLYITHQLVEAMGGHIGVESQLGRGSTFRVELPRRPEHAA